MYTRPKYSGNVLQNIRRCVDKAYISPDVATMLKASLQNHHLKKKQPPFKTKNNCFSGSLSVCCISCVEAGGTASLSLSLPQPLPSSSDRFVNPLACHWFRDSKWPCVSAEDSFIPSLSLPRPLAILMTTRKTHTHARTHMLLTLAHERTHSHAHTAGCCGLLV